MKQIFSKVKRIAYNSSIVLFCAGVVSIDLTLNNDWSVLNAGMIGSLVLGALITAAGMNDSPSPVLAAN